MRAAAWRARAAGALLLLLLPLVLFLLQTSRRMLARRNVDGRLQIAAHSDLTAAVAAVPIAQVSCKGLAGQSYDATVAVLAAAAAEAAACCPGLLLLDDADLLMPAASGEGPSGFEQVRRWRALLWSCVHVLRP